MKVKPRLLRGATGPERLNGELRGNVTVFFGLPDRDFLFGPEARFEPEQQQKPLEWLNQGIASIMNGGVTVTITKFKA